MGGIGMRRFGEAYSVLSSKVGDLDVYDPVNTCRDFSQQQFSSFQSQGLGEPSAPPPRPASPNSPSTDIPWSFASTVSASEWDAGDKVSGPE